MQNDKTETDIREYIEWISVRWHNDQDKNLPRVLLAGDSIVVGHGSKVHELLKDTLCVDYFATSKHVTDKDFMSDFEFMLSRRRYALIIFNNGLHGFEIDDDLYAPALHVVLAKILKRTDTERLMWRSSTPILSKLDLTKIDSERNSRVLRRNDDAATVALNLNLPIIDFYEPMVIRKDLFCSDALHFTEEGQRLQAEIIASIVRQQLLKTGVE